MSMCMMALSLSRSPYIVIAAIMRPCICAHATNPDRRLEEEEEEEAQTLVLRNRLPLSSRYMKRRRRREGWGLFLMWATQTSRAHSLAGQREGGRDGGGRRGLATLLLSSYVQ